MAEGYIIIDKATTYINENAKIGKGTVIKPNTTIEGTAVIGENSVIGPNSVICGGIIGDNVTVLMSYVNDASVGCGTTVGPFAHLRPGTVLGENCKIGNFVEIKNSGIGNGTKISHLTYIGDSDVGENVNFGCGTVTVNYDGVKKSRTTVADGAFIGCNTNLVAPVTVGKNAYTAAGSTITADVPAGALGLSRVKQTNIDGWADKKFPKKDKGKNG